MPEPIGPDTLVMFVGDTHGFIEQWTYLLSEAKHYSDDEYKRTAIKHFVQLGDFGYWEHNVTPEIYEELKEDMSVYDISLRAHVGAAYLDALSEMMVGADSVVYWIDGNHENHTMLRALYGPGGPRFKPAGQGFWEIRPGIIYIPRATTWVWGHTKFLGLGGAYSIDKDYRLEQHKKALNKARFDKKMLEKVEGISYIWECWWPEELITEAELAKAQIIGKVDVVLAHDAPSCADINLQFQIQGQGKRFLKADASSTLMRHYCEQLLLTAYPAHWIHGHYHLRYSMPVPLAGTAKCRVTGLNMNGTGREAYVVYTPEELLVP